MTKAEKYPQRRGKPDARYAQTDREAGHVELLADDAGLITITNDAEERIADAFGLAIAKPTASSKES